MINIGERMDYYFIGELHTGKQQQGKLDWNKVRIKLCYNVNNSLHSRQIFRNKDKLSIIRSERCTNLGIWNSERSNLRYR